MTESTVVSPLALYTAKKWFGISPYNLMICFLHTEYQRGISERGVLLQGYLSQLLFKIFPTSSIGFKSRESPGHSKTGIILISRMCFADFELLQSTLSCNKSKFFSHP